MKNKNIFKFLIGLAIFSSVGALNISMPVSCLTQHQNNKSPNLCCRTQQMLEKFDNSGLCEIIADVEQVDQTLNIKFNSIDKPSPAEEAKRAVEKYYPLPELADDEVYFIVLIDGENKGPLKYAYLNKNSDGTYSCSMEAPYYSNRVDLHVYKQKVEEPAFLIREENAIGRAKFLMPHDAAYMRDAKTKLTVLDKDGNVNQNARETTFLRRLTPNFYSIECRDPDIAGWEKVGKIILPDGQKELLSLDETVIPDNYFIPGAAPDETAASKAWPNAVYPNSGFFTFYLPPEVTEFKFQIFHMNVSDKKDDIKHQFDIKLDRK